MYNDLDEKKESKPVKKTTSKKTKEVAKEN